MIDIDLCAEDFDKELDKVRMWNETKRVQREIQEVGLEVDLRITEDPEKEQKARIEVFLNELTGLSQKYGLYIKGCGCCGSPWILDEECQKTYDDLTYMDDKYMIPDLDHYF